MIRVASPLAEAHIEAQRRLRSIVAAAIERIWRGLGAWNEGDADRFTAAAVPLVLSAQRTSVALTDAYLAQALERPPLGVDAEDLIGAAVRGGAPPAEVYRRPFVTLWSALAERQPWQVAFAKGLQRATSAAAMDVQLSMRATADAVGAADPGIFGFRRAAHAAACTFCKQVDGNYVKSAGAMALHNHCGCGLEAVTAPHRGADTPPPAGVAVHAHGELGPVLADPTHDFTSLSDI